MGLFFADKPKSDQGRIAHRDLDKHLRQLGMEREHRESIISAFDEHRNGREYLTGKDINDVMKRVKNNHEDGIDSRHVEKAYEHLLGLVKEPEAPAPDHSDLHFKN